MKRVKMKMFKKLGTLALAATMLALPMASSTFASSSLIVSEEGIGINVYNPKHFERGEKNILNIGIMEIIDGDKVSVAGGSLWATWRNGVDFRANYDHSTKEHRCTAQNVTGYSERSRWEDSGETAISPWVDQSLFGNKVFADTRD